MAALRALIFDVDGTLADTEATHLASFNAAFDQLQLGWHWSADAYRRLLDVTGGKERLAHYIGTLHPADNSARRELLLQVPQIHALKTQLYTALVADGGLPLRHGVQRLIDEALHAGCKLAIASTTSAANIDALLLATLGARGPGLFSTIACGDQVRNKKPAPDIYLLALHDLGVDADAAVAFEDSAHGLHSAQGAGLRTIVTPTFWTEDADFGGASLLLPHLGSAEQPLPHELGRQLRRAAWLGLDELDQLPPLRTVPQQATDAMLASLA